MTEPKQKCNFAILVLWRVYENLERAYYPDNKECVWKKTPIDLKVALQNNFEINTSMKSLCSIPRSFGQIIWPHNQFLHS